eukprot:COSAG05_NODE_68_length_22188_cov_8.265019_9_plen_87_part_00
MSPAMQDNVTPTWCKGSKDGIINMVAVGFFCAGFSVMVRTRAPPRILYPLSRLACYGPATARARTWPRWLMADSPFARHFAVPQRI